ncbi:hypothetical protein BOX15_Mlig003008g1, partial [Macrostomum lignano]
CSSLATAVRRFAAIRRFAQPTLSAAASSSHRCCFSSSASPPDSGQEGGSSAAEPAAADAGSLASQVGLPDSLPSLAESAIEGVGGVPGPQLWLETLRVQSDVKLGLVSLDPRIFHQVPRPHVLHENLRWQGLYRLIDYRSITYKTEVARGHKKPWPQKGFGLARHGNRLAPQFFGGAQVKGPRGPESFFTILPQHIRVLGLVQALSARCLQDDLHIVDSLELPADNGAWLQTLVESRGWGPTVLFVADTDKAPVNMALACDSVRYYSLMPYYGINVWSILKHDTLVMTVDAAKKVQARLLHHLSRRDPAGLRNPDWDEPQATHFTGHYQPDRVAPPVYY